MRTEPAPESKTSPGPFLERVVSASRNWRADDQRLFRAFFCSDASDRQLCEILRLDMAALVRERLRIVRLCRVTTG